MTEGPSAKWNSAGTRMPSRKKPVLPGLAPRIAYSAIGHADLRDAGQRLDAAERIAACPRRRPGRLRVDAHHGRHRLRRDDRLEGLPARRQPDLARPSRRRDVDGDVGGLIARRDRLQAVPARRGRHREPALVVGLGHRDTVDEHRRALDSAGARRAPARSRATGRGSARAAGPRRRLHFGRLASAAPSSVPGVELARARRASALPPSWTGRRVGARLDRRLGDRAAVGRRPLPVRAARGQQHERADGSARAQGGSVVSHNPSRDEAARPRTA